VDRLDTKRLDGLNDQASLRNPEASFTLSFVLEEGTTLAGRYRIEQSLGRGGMAEVFLARDLRLDRPVALKVLAPALSSDESFVARFRREAQAAAGLSHPNIVTVYDWGEALGSYFIVMEYAPGRTLAEVIDAEAPVSAERTALIGAQIAAALAAAHANGVVHRDIKPSNVILGPEDTVEVTDFGIAHVVEEASTRLTATGTVLGTPAYLPPEQAEGRAVDARSDLYSLGVVLYELATGATPFQGQTTAALAYQHARQSLEPPSARNPAVPAALDAIITEALAKDPAERPASAELLRRRLSALSGSSPGRREAVTEAAATRVLPAARASRRRIVWGAAAFAAGLIAAFALFFAFRFSHSTPRASATSSHTTTRHTTSSTAPTTTATTTTKPLPTSFAGYQVVAGTGAGSLFCPDGVALGRAGQAAPASPAKPGQAADGANGQGGQPGCGSNGGNGGRGGKGAPGVAGGTGGNGGAGGCQPATLAQMQQGTQPCNGTGSDGGDGGDGGKAAPGAPGGDGGAGGAGGNTTNARGGKGGNGGDAKHGVPGADGSPGGRGGGPDGTTSGVTGEDGRNGG
jgi:serine/threonine protein kinase